MQHKLLNRSINEIFGGKFNVRYPEYKRFVMKAFDLVPQQKLV